MEKQFKTIIKECRSNNRKAQSELYKLCYAPLMKICWRYNKNRDDALTLLNDGFLKILLNLTTYNDTQEFIPWVNTIMIRTAIDAFRRDKNYKADTELTDDYDSFQEVHAPTDALVQALSAEDIREMVFELPAVERLVFNLYELEGFRHKEIAEQMNVTERTTKRYLQAAKLKLREKIAKHTNVKKVS